MSSAAAHRPGVQSLGDRMTPFVLPRVGGGEVSLGELLGRARAVVVVFWSGVCSHCRRYDTYLEELERRRPGTALLAVACRQRESLADVTAAVAERRLTFPIAYDADRRVAHAWLVEQTPRAFLLDGGGVLRYRGAIDNFKYPADPRYEGYLDAALEAVLAGREPQRPETAGFGCAIESVYYAMPAPYGRLG